MCHLHLTFLQVNFYRQMIVIQVIINAKLTREDITQQSYIASYIAIVAYKL